MIADDLVGCLEEAWRPAREDGVLGPVSIDALHRHACGFILGSWRDLPAGKFVDCGAGAGALGILLALELPSSQWTLVDSNERRCALARRAVTAVGLKGRVRVEHASVEMLARRPEWRGSQHGVVARLFGPATELAECGLPLVCIDGALVVSVSDTTREQWTAMDLLSSGCVVSDVWSTVAGQYLAVRRLAAPPSELPRRKAARLRTPLG